MFQALTKVLRGEVTAFLFQVNVAFGKKKTEKKEKSLFYQ